MRNRLAGRLRRRREGGEGPGTEREGDEGPGTEREGSEGPRT